MQYKIKTFLDIEFIPLNIQLSDKTQKYYIHPNSKLR